MWCTDVTYIPLQRGFLFLVAVMDWASRKVLAWRLSNTLEASFCVAALREALECYGPPEIFNSDQGSQFTSVDFTDVLKEAGIASRWTARGDRSSTSAFTCPSSPLALRVLAPVAVDRSPSPPRSWAKTAGSPQVHLSDARDRRDGLRQARV